MSEFETTLVYIGCRKLARAAQRYSVMYLKKFFKKEGRAEERVKGKGGMERDREGGKMQFCSREGKESEI